MILVADNDKQARHLLCRHLQLAGFDTLEADTGLKAYRLAQKKLPAAVVLEVDLPGWDGFQVCRMMRDKEATKLVRVLMLTARCHEQDRVTGFQAGADGYVTKPFNPTEVVLRLQALLRRPAQEARPGSIKVGPFDFDLRAVRLTIDGQVRPLSLLEFKLLYLLASNIGRVVGREVIFREVWDYSETTQSRTLDTHMTRLRKKLKAHAGWLKTTRQEGYLFSEPDVE